MNNPQIGQIHGTWLLKEEIPRAFCSRTFECECIVCGATFLFRSDRITATACVFCRDQIPEDCYLCGGPGHDAGGCELFEEIKR